jgi:hypothetical protein
MPVMLPASSMPHFKISITSCASASFASDEVWDLMTDGDRLPLGEPPEGVAARQSDQYAYDQPYDD